MGGGSDRGEIKGDIMGMDWFAQIILFPKRGIPIFGVLVLALVFFLDSTSSEPHAPESLAGDADGSGKSRLADAATLVLARYVPAGRR